MRKFGQEKGGFFAAFFPGAAKFAYRKKDFSSPGAKYTRRIARFFPGHNRQ